MRYMLDTNICIYIIKGKPSCVAGRILECEPGEIVISSICYSELMAGVEKSSCPEKNRIALMRFLTSIPILAYDGLSGDYYGRIRADLERKGTPIGPMDQLIAAHAMAEGCVLVTNNTREFERIPGLELENWAEEN